MKTLFTLVLVAGLGFTSGVRAEAGAPNLALSGAECTIQEGSIQVGFRLQNPEPHGQNPGFAFMLFFNAPNDGHRFAENGQIDNAYDTATDFVFVYERRNSRTFEVIPNQSTTVTIRKAANATGDHAASIVSKSRAGNTVGTHETVSCTVNLI